MSGVVGVVAEGSSDFAILRAVVLDVLPSVTDVRCLQPTLDEVGAQAGGRGGWTAVRAWCEENGELLSSMLDGNEGDWFSCVVISVDADAVYEVGIAKRPEEITDRHRRSLCDEVKSWLRKGGAKRVPNRCVIAIPTPEIESWVVAAMFTKLPVTPERMLSPTRMLLERGKLALGTSRNPIKDPATYRDFATHVVSKASRVRKACGEAEKALGKLESVRKTIASPGQ